MCIFLRRTRALLRSSKGTVIRESLKTLRLGAVQAAAGVAFIKRGGVTLSSLRRHVAKDGGVEG